MAGSVNGPRWLLTVAVPVMVLMLGSATPALAQQPAPQDTTAADTVLTARERALQRLRALPTSPIQPDTLAGDTLAADTAAGDTLPRGLLPGDLVGADTLQAPPDTAGQITVEDSVDIMPDGAIQADSVLALLRGLEGYARTEYEGDAAVFQADSNRLRMLGQGRVGREGNALSTDSLIVYDGETGVACGYGNPVLQGEQEPVESARVCYDINRDLGMAEGARTRFTQQGTWYVRGPGNRVYILTGGEQSRLYGERTDFTSCDLPEPHYTFQARTLKMVENDVMVARDVTLRFEDVPVFWLPWMVQSMKDGRRSGLLTPQFGLNDIVRNQSGYNRSISNLGFYWALNDYLSARASFGWFSNNYTSLEGALSYHWLRQFLQGGATVKQYWRENGSRALTINTNNSWRPDERTRLSVDGTYASSTDFVRRNSFDPRELNRQIRMNGSGTRSFDWGKLTVGARRTQHLSDEKVDLMLPRASLTLSPLTLYTSDSGETTLTWSGSADATRRATDVLDTIPGARDNETLDAQANHRIGFGRFSISQGVDWTQETEPFKPGRNEPDCFFTLRGESCVPQVDEEGNVIEADTALPALNREALNWSSSASYQQDLWTGTSLTPSVNISGSRIQGPRTGGATVSEPVRFSLSTSLNTTIFGFWPGVGPFSQIRHKISPRIGWSYSPAPGNVSALQDSIFGVSELRDQNRLTLSFNQTFEAKYAEDDTVSTEVAEDTLGGVAGGAEPRRLPQARKVTLLSINTSTPFTYDFVAREQEGRGFLTDQVNNSLRSDLLEGLQITTTHDLFRESELDEDAEDGAIPPREFSPFLTRLDARFSIDDDFWLFRVLGLSGGEDVRDAEPEDEEPAEGTGGARDPAIGAESDPGRSGGVGGIIPRGGAMDAPGRVGIGGWSASLNYSLERRRAEEQTEGNQMLTGNFSFSPTAHWRVNWSTAYSFTEREFGNHVLTLSRDLHRWQANFDFVKAQNGNFMFQFRVNLIDNPDLKLEYDQHTDPSTSGLQPDN